MTNDSFFLQGASLGIPPFGSPSARPGSLWGQGRLESPHFMLSSSRVCGRRDLSLPSCLPSATLKAGELLATICFLDFNFFLPQFFATVIVLSLFFFYNKQLPFTAFAHESI